MASFLGCLRATFLISLLFRASYGEYEKNRFVCGDFRRFGVSSCAGITRNRSVAEQQCRNSPVISGNGNTVNYQSQTGFPSAETIRAQRPNISERQYQAIQPGMTYDEVLEIVKIPGKEAASTGRVQVYTWGTEVYVYMTVTLVDGKVQSKSH